MVLDLLMKFGASVFGAYMSSRLKFILIYFRLSFLDWKEEMNHFQSCIFLMILKNDLFNEHGHFASMCVCLPHALSICRNKKGVKSPETEAKDGSS